MVTQLVAVVLGKSVTNLVTNIIINAHSLRVSKLSCKLM